MTHGKANNIFDHDLYAKKNYDYQEYIQTDWTTPESIYFYIKNKGEEV